MIQCSEHCDESKEVSIFKVSILTDDERAIVQELHKIPAKEYRCVHCDAEAEEVEKEKWLVAPIGGEK